jgi:hypothetical protein
VNFFQKITHSSSCGQKHKIRACLVLILNSLLKLFLDRWSSEFEADRSVRWEEELKKNRFNRLHPSCLWVWVKMHFLHAHEQQEREAEASSGPEQRCRAKAAPLWTRTRGGVVRGRTNVVVVSRQSAGYWGHRHASARSHRCFGAPRLSARVRGKSKALGGSSSPHR